jgi:hypothetical protein
MSFINQVLEWILPTGENLEWILPTGENLNVKFTIYSTRKHVW